MQMNGKVVEVVEKPEYRMVTVRVTKPWPDNIWQDYKFRDDSKELSLGMVAVIKVWESHAKEM